MPNNTTVVHTAKDLVDYINNTFVDPSCVYIEFADGAPLIAVNHKKNDMQDGSFTHDLVLSSSQ